MSAPDYNPPEESLAKVVDFVLFKRLFHFAKPYIWMLILALFLAGIVSGTEIALPYLTKIGIDQYIISSGKLIDLEKIPPDKRNTIKQHHDGKFVMINDLKMVIKDGVLDPEDRKILIDRDAIDPNNYYLLNLERYDSNDVAQLQRILTEHSTLFIPSSDTNKYFISVDNLFELAKSDQNLIRHPDWVGVAKISIVYICILVLGIIVMFGQVYTMAWVGQYIMFDIRLKVFEHIERLPIQFFNKQPTGRLVTRTTNDVNVLNEMFTSILVDLFKDILKLIGIICILLVLSPQLAFITFSLLPFIIIVTWIFKVKMRRAFRLVRVKIALINSMLSEHLSGIKIIQMFAKEKILYDKFKQKNHECYQANMRQLVVHASFSPFIVFIQNLGIALILYYGGGQVIRNTVSLGTLVAFLSYLTMFFHPIRDIAEKFNIMQSAMASSERIFQILDKSTEDAEDHQLVNPEKPIQGNIQFDNVWFAYEKEDWVLKDVSFSVSSGETIALVGATGSGKTTIINLLSKFFDIQKGNILIDKTNINDYSRYFLRRQMAIVLQDVFLFSGDIRSNIRLNEKHITNKDIETAAKIVHADHFISKLPDGYSHSVGEGGTTFSQGQRQLLAFARALAFNPAILILDEATSNIDSETEKWIQQALDKLLSSRTAVVVAHRLSTIKKADKIIVMHEGRICEIGDHASLLKKKNIYYKLYQYQYKHQET